MSVWTITSEDANVFIDGIIAEASCGVLGPIQREGCFVTVGQFEQCLEELGERLAAFHLGYTCADAGQSAGMWWDLGPLPGLRAGIVAAC
jgi:hypothetical protein